MYIGLHWKNLEGANWTDVFSESDFELNCIDQLLIHPVTGSGERPGFAFCLKTVNSNEVLLDYRPFPTSNIAENNYLGCLHLLLSRNKQLSITKASWRLDGQDSYSPIDFEVTRPKRKPKISKRVFDLLSVEALSSSEDFTNRINSAFDKKPTKTMVTTTAYLRNPLVTQWALQKANGICQKCNQQAPFISKNTGNPYLEVHHVTPLSKSGEDTIDNVLAICPNCHRQIHDELV